MAAGVVATALAFGLTLLALVYLIGPVSGSHVNPAVTIGALLARRISLTEAVGYGSPFAGGIVRALALWGTFSTSPLYSRPHRPGHRRLRQAVDDPHRVGGAFIFRPS